MRSHARCLGYARVSSRDQAIGSSLQDQQDAITAYAKTRGLTVARMYVEAQSAVRERIESRVQMQSLLADVRTGDLVLVDKIDRWSRDPEFTYKSVREILQARASFYAIGDAIDPSTSEGDTALGFRILFAREEHKRIKQRMVGTRRLLRDRGYFADGLLPWGYKRQDVKGPEKNILQPDDDELARVREAFILCISGKSLSAISEAMGVPRDKVFHALRNRAYLGEVRDSGFHWIRGKHAPVIDADTFMKANEALDGRRHGTRGRSGGVETTDWWLRDIARCIECKAKMTAVYGGSPDNRRYYFGCGARCGAKYVRVDSAESNCDPLVADRLTSLREELSRPADSDRTHRTGAESVDDKLSKLIRRRERYAEAYADGAITREAMRAAIAKLDDARTKIEAAALVPKIITPAQRREALRGVEAIRRRWQRAPKIVKRQIVSTLAMSVAIGFEAAPVFTWRTSEEIARGGVA